MLDQKKNDETVRRPKYDLQQTPNIGGTSTRTTEGEVGEFYIARGSLNHSKMLNPEARMGETRNHARKG